MASPATTSPPTPPPGTCGHCGGPLPPDAPRTDDAGARFCCYGCRLLGVRPDATARAASAREASGAWFRVGLGAMIAGQAMVLGLAVNLSEPEGAVRVVLHGALAVSALAVLALLGWPLARASWDCACNRRPGVEPLFLSGVVGALGASAWSSLTGEGAVYYEVVAVLLTVYTAGRALTARAREHALAETGRLRAAFATARVGGTTAPVEAVRPGDIVTVRPGEAVPVDGVVRRGTAFVRETPLTGEPAAVVRREGDAVLAGGFVEDAEIEVEAVRPGRGRRIDALLDAVERARGTLGATAAQARVDRLAARFLPCVLLTAVGTFVVWTSRGLWREGLFNALSVLLVACPCALGLATPLGLWQALATLGARGVAVRDAATVERLAEVDTVVLDKTGTLGEGRMTLADFVAEGDAATRSRLLEMVSAVEARSGHPVARAFRREDVPAGIEVRSFRAVAGSGVEAEVAMAGIGARSVRIGRAAWIVGDAPDAAARALAARLRTPPGAGLVWVAVDGTPAGVAALGESARPSAARTLQALRDIGLQVRLMTGDTPERARALLSAAGAGEGIAIEAGLAPEEKAGRVRALRDEGRRVLFVGDGINDAPALRAAHVGAALAEGAPLAGASADLVLCGSDLHEIPFAVDLARRVRDSIGANLRFAAFYNFVGMALAATGRLHPIVAALLMAGSSAVVGWRAWRHAGCGTADAAPVRRGGPRRLVVPAALLAQIPVLAWLGDLRGAPLAATGAVLGIAAFAAWRHARSVADGRDDASARFAAMSWAMAGPANLAMLAGWWADAGFGRVMRDGMCLCCAGHEFFAPGARIPWMYLAMWAAGLPAMAPALPAWPGRAARWPSLLLAGAGMALGMSMGARAALAWAGPLHPWQFPAAFAGMTAGMLLGMGFGCGVAEAVAARSRSLPRTPVRT